MLKGSEGSLYPPPQTYTVLGRARFGDRFPSYSGMSRPLRFIPDGGALVEVTCRTLQSRFLLRPRRDLDEIIVGVLGRAQRLYKVRFCGYMCASNHYHFCVADGAAAQSGLPLCYINSHLAT